MLLPTAGVLLMLALLVGLVVLSILELVYLWRSAWAFSQYHP